MDDALAVNKQRSRQVCLSLCLGKSGLQSVILMGATPIPYVMAQPSARAAKHFLYAFKNTRPEKRTALLVRRYRGIGNTMVMVGYPVRLPARLLHLYFVV